jgi:hypothetical protein
MENRHCGSSHSVGWVKEGVWCRNLPLFLWAPCCSWIPLRPGAVPVPYGDKFQDFRHVRHIPRISRIAI